MYVTPWPDPIGESRGDDASLVLRQRERKKLSVVWQLLFCRLFNESAYRHLDLQFYNLIVCRNPTSPDEDVSMTYIPITTHAIKYTILLDK